MSNVKTRKRLRLLVFLLSLAFGWLVHNYFAFVFGVAVKNFGISFGWGGNLVTGFGLIFLVVLTGWWWKSKPELFLVLIGGWINLIDRLFFGYVRDYWRFISVYNNLADWLIGIGVGWFILTLWKQNQK